MFTLYETYVYVNISTKFSLDMFLSGDLKISRPNLGELLSNTNSSSKISFACLDYENNSLDIRSSIYSSELDSIDLFINKYQEDIVSYVKKFSTEIVEKNKKINDV